MPLSPTAGDLAPHPSEPSRRRVLMVGPDPRSRGGIATAAGHLRDGPLGSRHDLRYVATTCDGSRVAKLRAAIAGVAETLRWLAFGWPDLVHVHTSSGPSFARKAVVVVAAHSSGVPVALHIHAGNFDRYYDGSGAVKRFAIRKVLELADVVLVLSAEWEDRIARRVPRAITAVVANAVPVPPRPDREGTRGGPVVTLGRLGEQKGTHDLLHALASLNCDAESVLAGDGDVDGAIDLAARLGLRRVQVRTWVGPTDRDELFRRAACFVLPSYAEGLPMALLEAMAHGIPVVTTPVGAISELVTPEVTGLLVTPGDREAIAAAIGRVLGDAEFADRVGDNGRTLVLRRYSLQVQASRLSRIYAEMAVRPNQRDRSGIEDGRSAGALVSPRSWRQVGG